MRSPKKIMPKKLRYTPGPPPAKVLGKYPNWLLALDEEGEGEQDETTIRPDTVSDHIGPQTQYTAADITFVSGRRLPALLTGMTELWNGNVESITVYQGKEMWHLEVSDRAWWPSRFPEGNEALVDQSNFPATIVSRLPGVSGGVLLKLELLANGKLFRPETALRNAPVHLPFEPKDISREHVADTSPPNHETRRGNHLRSGLHREWETPRVH